MLSLIVAVALTAPYELADLKALEKQQSWAELVQHLSDIAPSKRDKDWEGLAERAGAGYLGTFEMKKPETAEAPMDAADDLIKKYPFLKQSKVFMGKRAEVAVKAYGLSFSNYRHSSGEDPWLDELRAMAESDTVTPDLPYRLAKEVVLPKLIAVTAFPLFKLSLDRGSKTLCKDADFHKALIGALEDGSWKSETESMSGKCWDDFKGPLTAALTAPKANNAFRRNACPLLASKNALPAAQKDACEKASQ
ncbi:MAG: hypothetical protein JNK82_19495 [Myxococcaceae bacterium]|nr:hypothetical protein [Myxococcaceae bacterium]